jgi:hypothetical protein
VDKAAKTLHQLTPHLAALGIGFVLAYLLCWMFESGVDGHAVTRWSDARCGFAVMVALLAWAFSRQASGTRP